MPSELRSRRRPRWPAVMLLAAAAHLSGCDRATGPPADRPGTVRVVTFGDSNTDIGWSTVAPFIRARSYVSDLPPRLAPHAHHDAAQLAGLVEQRWRATQGPPIRVVNHGVAGTTTGGGGHGGGNRSGYSAPNARTVVNGITRFEGEVLGRGYPWSGAEPASPVRRVNAFIPGPVDFAYVSIGTNDLTDGIPSSQTLENLEWMVQQWTGAGLAPDHLVLTTLPPRGDVAGVSAALPAINAGIRALASHAGTGLIDLAAYTSADDGVTWRDASLHVGDGVHYTTAVRAWIADQLVAWMAAHASAPAALR
ncbi:MAG: SGNH/GDSL hydrolase family protein [Longimicrobiaceae bacterium]